MSEAKKTIEIKCDTKDKIDWHSLTEFQGELKERNNTDIEKAKKSILRFGWSFPFYVYKEKETNYVLDGHCRLKVLKELEKELQQIEALKTKWGSKIVKFDKKSNAKNRKVIDYNPIIKIPIKGI